jgi:hypothetical protein
MKPVPEVSYLNFHFKHRSLHKGKDSIPNPFSLQDLSKVNIPSGDVLVAFSFFIVLCSGEFGYGFTGATLCPLLVTIKPCANTMNI